MPLVRTGTLPGGATAAGAPSKLGVRCSFDGWRSLAWKTASYFPGITLFTLTTLNILIHHTGSSGAIPLGAFFSLIALWFLISIPLCFSGAESSPWALRGPASQDMTDCVQSAGS